jgi:hypothetical protein
MSGRGRFPTFSGRESNCQFDSRPFFCPQLAFQMSKWVMRAHFRPLRFKSFPTVPIAQQSIEIWPFNSHSEVSGVHRDSLSQNGSCLGSVSAHSLTLPRTSLDSQASSWPAPFQCLCLCSRASFFFDSRASFLLTPATLQPLALVASPKLGLRQKALQSHNYNQPQKPKVNTQIKCMNAFHVNFGCRALKSMKFGCYELFETYEAT